MQLVMMIGVGLSAGDRADWPGPRPAALAALHCDRCAWHGPAAAPAVRVTAGP